jgi:LPXTG-motif cell wall-anchored protein
MRYLGSLLVVFGASGFILPLVMRDPPFWDSLNNDAPMVAGIALGLGALIILLSFVFKKKKPAQDQGQGQ